MDNLLILLGLTGPLAMGVTLLVLVILSQRLGAVTKRPKLYRLLFLAIGLLIANIVLRLLSLGTAISDPATNLGENLLVAAALTLGAAVAWYYWGWLLGERGGVSPATNTAQPRDKDSS